MSADVCLLVSTILIFLLIIMMYNVLSRMIKILHLNFKIQDILDGSYNEEQISGLVSKIDS